ncbi:MAG: hypothetical protein AB7U45_10380 [Desulfamplus sp.]
MLKHRLFTQWAADQMEATLITKDKAGYMPWEAQTHNSRWLHVCKEFEEVRQCIEKCCLEEKRTPDTVKNLQAELTDLALTAMMMAGGFDTCMSKLRRGRRQ